MTKYYGNTDFAGNAVSKRKPRKNPWWTFFKVVCWVIGSLVVAAGIALWILSYYVTPKYITELIEKKSSEYLNADIKIGGLDYKLFKHYPWIEFEVDSVYIISHSLDNIAVQEKTQLPAYADSLASVLKLQGKINLHSLMHKEINIKDIDIEKPSVNIVMVNDTISNFNIAKTKLPHISHLPEVRLGEVKIGAPVDFNFFSLQQQVEAGTRIESFFLAERNDKFYEIGFDGTVKGRYQEYEIPGVLPVKFTTTIRPDLPNLAILLKDLSLSLSGVKINAQGEFTADASGIDLNNARLSLTIDDLFSEINSLPETITRKITLPDGVSGYLPLEVEATLLSPFHIGKNTFRNISPDSLPSLNCEVKIAGANLSVTPPNGKRLEADDLYLSISGEYDPQNPDSSRITVNELRMHGEGISLNGEAEISDLLGEEQNLEGNIEFSTPLVESLAYLMPESSFKIGGLMKGDIQFNALAENFGKEGFKNLTLKGNVKTPALNVSSPQMGKIHLKNLGSDFNAMLPAYPINNYDGTKINFDFQADSVVAGTNGVNLILAGLKINLAAADTVEGAPNPAGKFVVSIKGLQADASGNRFRGENLEAKINGTLNSSANTQNYQAVSPVSGSNDALIASRIKHTPLVVQYNGGGILQTIMSMVTLNADISLGKGNFTTPQYIYPFEFKGVDLTTDLNDMKLSASDLSIAGTSLALSSRIDGIKPFILSNIATPLQVRADIQFLNVDINQLSWGYYGTLVAQGKDSVFYEPPVLPYTAEDSVCVAIPRNIDALVKLRATSAQYMAYRFSPLSTDIIVKDGDATISQLTVGAPYATAIVDWTYSTKQLDNIFMDLKARVKDFSFENFYSGFPSLVAKMPELKNFTGMVNADINCYFDMYPDMFMNAQSLAAKFDVKATELQFARAGKIERLTHLMLIQGDQPIHIQNIDITGGFHDNILQLNPFRINFDGYQLAIGGVNNTAGNMYYHFALEKSPFHLPFGVTLKGSFKHPEVRLGGTKINDYKAQLVTDNLNDNINANIMAYLQNGWWMFLKAAAKYEMGIESKGE